MKTTPMQTLSLILAVALAIQGVIPDAWPDDSIGWLRLVIALVAIVCTALLRSPVLSAAAVLCLAVTLPGCSQAIPVAGLVTPVNVHCDVTVSVVDGGSVTMTVGDEGSQWLDHYCGSDPSGGVEQHTAATSSPAVDVTAPVSVTATP